MRAEAPGEGLVASGYSVSVVVIVAVLGPFGPAGLFFPGGHTLVGSGAVVVGECFPPFTSRAVHCLRAKPVHRAELDELAGQVAIAVSTLIEVSTGDRVPVVFPLDDSPVPPLFVVLEVVMAQGLTGVQFDDDIAAVHVVLESCSRAYGLGFHLSCSFLLLLVNVVTRCHESISQGENGLDW
jgi:hypothetical protein